MALETLKDVKEIGGFPVFEADVDSHGIPNAFNTIGDDKPIVIDHWHNQISFQIQNGPIKEHGINGCQVDTIIETAKLILEGLHSYFPCDENRHALSNLSDSLDWLEKRKKNREARGVEGTNQA